MSAASDHVQRPCRAVNLDAISTEICPATGWSATPLQHDSNLFTSEISWQPVRKHSVALSNAARVVHQVQDIAVASLH